MNLDLIKTKTDIFKRRLQSRKRGSTVLLVLAMLSILLLLGVAFSYSTRLESQASFNYAELAQARTSAQSGLPMVLPMLQQASLGLTSTLQNWNTIPQTLQKMVKANGKTPELTSRDLAALGRAGLDVHQSKNGELESAPQANVQVRDLSGLVNLNAIDNQATMERVISAVLSGDNPKQKSAALMMLRGDVPNQQVNLRAASAANQDEPADLDPRDPNAQMLDNLARLRIGADAGDPLFTSSEIEKLRSFVTVFSQAPEVFNAPNGQSIDRIPLDAIDAKHVYETLRQAFPNKKNELLLQFAANVADFSDEDSEPTILNSSGDIVAVAADGAAATNYTIGVEMTPVISEVYPDAATSVAFGDDGQFVEIRNPWSRAINLTGWTLRTGSGSITLNAHLPAGGYLVVTDNYDKPNTEAPTGYGSLVTLFGNTADGASRQVMTQPALELTDRNGKVSLHSPQGHLADVFSYESTGQVDGKLSFQRTDPLVRGSVSAQATPFSPATGSAMNIEGMAAATKAWEDGNSTMTKLSQLFTLSTGFVEHGAADAGANADKVHASQMAEMKFPENFANNNGNNNTDPYPDNMDLRLIDIFTATSAFEDETELLEAQELAEESDSSSDRRSAYRAFREKLERSREQNRSRIAGANAESETTRTTVFSYGKLNVNTCSKYALLGLNLTPGNAAAKGGVADLITQFEGYRLRNNQTGHPPFRNISDFVTQFSPNLSRSNLDQLDTITDQVAVGSSAFEVVATNRLSPKDQEALESNDNSSGPRPATATAKWIISMDQEPYSVVSFTLVP